MSARTVYRDVEALTAAGTLPPRRARLVPRTRRGAAPARLGAGVPVLAPAELVTRMTDTIQAMGRLDPA
ncbi:hypothetical protein [Actinoplanes teichomyceticus]|uniref:hypothetical protein n=1 Tax=Actinoplanes teichomyceticus TaxID=1867 RepID=UPI001EF19BAB|nr:hypothetical protein [Actinoplanes teichomyceticus]